MALLPPVASLRLVLEDDDLPVPVVRLYLGQNPGAGNEWSPESHVAAVGDRENLAEFGYPVYFKGEQLYVQYVTGLDTVLFAPGFNDRVFHMCPRHSMVRQGTRTVKKKWPAKCVLAAIRRRMKRVNALPAPGIQTDALRAAG